MRGPRSRRVLAKAIILLTALLLTAGRAEAQQEKKPITKIIKVQHADVQRLSELLKIFPGVVQADPVLKTIAVIGEPESVAAIEAAIKSLDVPASPAKNIDLTFFLLSASEDDASGGTIPRVLEDVIAQLRQVFSHRGYRLWDTLTLRTRDDEGEKHPGAMKWVRGVVPASSTAASQLSYRLEIRSARIVSDDDGRLVRIDGLRLDVWENEKPEGEKAEAKTIASFLTDIDVREGQKVVVGKSSIGVAKSALILVVTAMVE